ncbi:MAG TPA: hypothetical protein VLA23_11245 [Candidatus Limnocylindrales bacterium]|nr:hypothetical protein [Candidatus Limnocylindrales bacterium]
MDASELLTKVREAMTSTTVYGEPIERDGVTVILASSVIGGGGGGAGMTPTMAVEGEVGAGATGEGSAVGFGVTAKPAGAFVIRGEDVEWVPAIDRNRQILFGSLIGILVILTIRGVLYRLLKR